MTQNDCRNDSWKFGWNWSIPCWIVNSCIFNSHFEYVDWVTWLKTQPVLKTFWAPPTYSEMVNFCKEMSPGWPKMCFFFVKSEMASTPCDLHMPKLNSSSQFTKGPYPRSWARIEADFQKLGQLNFSMTWWPCQLCMMWWNGGGAGGHTGFFLRAAQIFHDIANMPPLT